MRGIRSMAWLLGLCAACGGSAARSEPSAEASSGAEHARSGRPYEGGADPLRVTGILGSLSQAEIHNALEPRAPRFERCFGTRHQDVPWISGSFTISFRVGLDGGVERASPQKSELGDRVVERCVLGVAESTHFPKPHGGEAEFTWSFEMPADPEVRPADVYPGLERALPVLLAAVERCGADPAVALTGYVDENGKVVAAGAAAASDALPTAETLDCVTQAVVGVTIASPGSYAAKFSAVLP